MREKKISDNIWKMCVQNMLQGTQQSFLTKSIHRQETQELLLYFSVNTLFCWPALELYRHRICRLYRYCV